MAQFFRLEICFYLHRFKYNLALGRNNASKIAEDYDDSVVLFIEKK